MLQYADPKLLSDDISIYQFLGVDMSTQTQNIHGYYSVDKAAFVACWKVGLP